MAEQQNPLVKPSVVKVLLENAPKSMWKTCRLVCKPWHDELLPRWRKQMNTRIGGLGTSQLLPDDKDDNKLPKMCMDVSSFLRKYQPNDIRQLQKYPFRSVTTMPGQVLISGTQGQLELQNRFWSMCGPWLHQLHFHGAMFKDLEMLKNIIFHLTPNLQKLEFSGCDTLEKMKKEIKHDWISSSPGNVQVQPNLKVLKICLQTKNKIKGSRYNGTFPLSFFRLLSVFTDIEELCLDKFKRYEISFLLDGLEKIRRANQNSVLNMKKLDLKGAGDDYLTPETVTKLCALSLPLEELCIQIYWVAEMEMDVGDTLRMLFSKYSTLTKFSLTIEDHDFVPEFQYNIFPQTLTQLELIGDVVKDWSFLAYTTNLTKLKLDNDGEFDRIKYPDQFPGNVTPLLEFLTTFYYKCGVIEPIKPDQIEMFGRIIPNVKKLSLSVDCAGFEIVCNTWRQLTYLKTTYGFVKEATFIANVNKLTSLTCLKVNVRRQRHIRCEITDFGNDSIQNGFLLMPKLQRICITFSHGTSEQLLRDLYEKVENTEEVYFVKDNNQLEKYRLKTIAGHGPQEPISLAGFCCTNCFEKRINNRLSVAHY